MNWLGQVLFLIIFSCEHLRLQRYNFFFRQLFLFIYFTGRPVEMLNFKPVSFLFSEDIPNHHLVLEVLSRSLFM